MYGPELMRIVEQLSAAVVEGRTTLEAAREWIRQQVPREDWENASLMLKDWACY